MNKRVVGLLGLMLSAPAWSAPNDQFDWLSGQWCGKQGAARIEEMWTTPAGKTLLGVGRTLGAAGMRRFEYMPI